MKNQFSEKQNRLELPIYTPTEAAHYLRIPIATVKSWTLGREYPRKDGESGKFRPIIATINGKLSFHNLVELHVLRALRTLHSVEMENVRRAISYAEEKLDIDRLLLSKELQTGGGDIFIERFGELISLSRSGQIALKEIIEKYLQRVDRDNHNVPIRLYPYVFDDGNDSRPVVIDPRIAFGYPTIKGTGIKTSIIVMRIDSGEEIEDLSKDYGIKPEILREAILYERRTA